MKENKNAIDVVRQMIADGNLVREVAERYFPELKESEDEKIRKEIIKLVKFYYGSSLAFKHTVSENEMIAWLEKQGEQKPVEEYNITGISSKNAQGKLGEIIKNLNHIWSEEDYNKISSIKYLLHELDNHNFDSWFDSLKYKLQYNKPVCDEDYINDLIKHFSQNEKLKNTKEDIVIWLKSIKQEKQWKPSEEQMKAIQEAMNIVGILTITGSKINSLYQDLKKLRKE